MKKYFVITVIILTSAFFSGCESKQKTEVTKKEEVRAVETHEEGEEEGAFLTDEQIKAIGVELGSIEEKELTSALKTNGVLKVPNQNKASVNSIYSGVIKSLLIQPGNKVAKGQTIATIANPDFIQAQSDYLNVNSKITMAELEVNRQKILNAGNAGALKNLQAAESELRSLRTARSSLAQQIQLMGVNPGSLRNGRLVSTLSIKSPISGIVSDVMVKMGSYVDVSTAVAEIVDNSQLHLDLYVYEKDMPRIRDNQLIHFTLTNNPGKEYDAQIYSLGSTFEGESKAVTVHAKVQGEKTGLIEGMTITAAISLTKASVPAVPTEAIVNSQGQDFIFIVSEGHAVETGHVESKDSVKHKKDEGNETNKEEHKAEKGLTFEKIPVAKGTTDVGYTEITLLREVPKNAKVVVKGAFFVLAKMTNTGEHDH